MKPKKERVTRLDYCQYLRTIYPVKHGLLDDDLRQQLKSPAIQMRLA